VTDQFYARLVKHARAFAGLPHLACPAVVVDDEQTEPRIDPLNNRVVLTRADYRDLRERLDREPPSRSGA
jgi:hypothetical protein